MDGATKLIEVIEVDVPKSRMTGFLADAHELQIQCLTSDNESITNDKPMANSTPASKQNKSKASKKRAKNDPEESMKNNSSVNEYLNSIQEKMNTSVKSKDDSVLSELNDSQLSNLSYSVTQDEKSRIEEVEDMYS